MSPSQRIGVLVAWTIAAWGLTLSAANAYIDAGSTSVIFQALIAGLAAAGTGIAMFWSRIRGLFTRKATDATADPAPAERAGTDA